MWVEPVAPLFAEHRPIRATADMRREAADEIVGELIRANLIDGDGADLAATQLAEIGKWDEDGYDIAKRLDDRHHWAPSAEMVEILDGFGNAVSSRLRDAAKAWAERNPIAQPLPDGTHVRWRGGTGRITGVSDYGAHQYEVLDDKNPADSTSRWLVNFEVVQVEKQADGPTGAD